MENSSNLLEELIKYIYITRKGANGQKITEDMIEKINEAKKKSLAKNNYRSFFVDDYLKNNNKYDTDDKNNFHINNKTPLLHIIICDEVTKIDEDNAPSMCDYLLLNAQNTDFILMCELKKIQEAYYEKELNKAKTQLQKTFNILQNISCTNSSEVYGVIGMISSLEGSFMRKSFQKFASNPSNNKFKNKIINLQSLDNKHQIQTYITNNITINQNKPYITIESRKRGKTQLC